MKQDLKAELENIVGEDVIDQIEQVQADAELAKDLKEQAMEKYNQSKVTAVFSKSKLRCITH